MNPFRHLEYWAENENYNQFYLEIMEKKSTFA